MIVFTHSVDIGVTKIFCPLYKEPMIRPSLLGIDLIFNELAVTSAVYIISALTGKYISSMKVLIIKILIFI